MGFNQNITINDKASTAYAKKRLDAEASMASESGYTMVVVGCVGVAHT